MNFLGKICELLVKPIWQPWCRRIFFSADTVMGISLCFILLLGIATGNQYNPQPNPESVVAAKNARFTVLTSRLIRMEWGQSVDAATFTFINRNLVKPSFTVKQNGSWTYIETDELKVSYTDDYYSCRAHCL